MATPVRSILKSVSKKGSTLDILSFVNYPYYDWLLSQVPHNFHLYKGDRLPCSWDEDVLHVPNNVTLDINPDIPLNLDINLVLCHNRFEQFDIAKLLSNFLHLPLCLVHQQGPRDMRYHNQWYNILQRRGNSNIFLGKNIQEQWDLPGFIIPPGIPEIPRNYNKQKGNIAHIWCSKKEQNFISENLGPLSFIKGGDFSSCMILVNSTTQLYPVHVLVAMAHGCCVATQNIPELDNLIEHEVSGLIYKDVPDLSKILATYKNRSSKCNDIGQEGRKRVLANFPVSDFVKRFDIALKQSTEIIYTR